MDGTSFGGVMGLNGTVNVVVLPNVIVIPVMLDVAGVGQGGSTTSPFTFDAAPWTIGRGKVRTPNGMLTVSGTGFTTPLPTPSGPTVSRLTLVTPTFVSALGNLGPTFTTLEITVRDVAVPEPGTPLLLGTCLAGLALVSRRRR